MSRYEGEVAPPAWDIRPATADGSGGWLRIGHRAYAIADITSVSPRPVVETGVAAQVAVLAVFLVAGLAFVLPVTLAGGQSRLLIGGALFFAVAATGAAEMARRRPAVLHQLEIRLRDGTSAGFSSADPRDCAALAAAIEVRLAEASSRTG